LISLILAVLSSSAIALLWKVAEIKKYSSCRIIQFNYLSATVLSLLFFRYQPIITGNDLPGVTLLAFLFGLIFVSSFFLYATNISANGAILSSSVSKMGILIPVFLSLVLFRESVTHRQFSGLILGNLSLLLYFSYSAFVSLHLKRNDRHSLLLLLLLFVSQGLAEMSGKLFGVFFNHSLRPLFLGLLFFFSFLLTSYYIILTQKNVSGKKEPIFGLLLGVPNFFSSYFLIDAFVSLNSSLVFTFFGVGTILVVSILSMLLFKERITKLQVLFLLTILITIWLMQS